MGQLTDDQKELRRNKEAYDALAQLRSLKTDKTNALADIEAVKQPIASDIQVSEWAAFTMAQAMNRIGLGKEDFREVVSKLDILADCNSKIPQLESYLTTIKSSLTNPDYVTEIEAELA